MEYVDGQLLAELPNGGPLGPRRTMDVVAQVAAALHERTVSNGRRLARAFGAAARYRPAARHHPTALGQPTDPVLNRSRRAGQVSNTEKAEVITMGLLNKVRNRFMMSRGRTKQETGRVTRNRSMQAKGMTERVSGAARQVAEQAKDAGRNIREAARH